MQLLVMSLASFNLEHFFVFYSIDIFEEYSLPLPFYSRTFHLFCESHSFNHRAPLPQWVRKRNLWPHFLLNFPRELGPRLLAGIWAAGGGVSEGRLGSPDTLAVGPDPFPIYAPLFCSRKPLAWTLADPKSWSEGWMWWVLRGGGEPPPSHGTRKGIMVPA